MAHWTPQQIEKGKTLAKRQKSLSWAIGDYCLEMIPASEGGGPGNAKVQAQLDKLIQLTGLEYGVTTLDGYRLTARQWPKKRRLTTASFTTHQVLSWHPDRFKIITPGMSVHEAEMLRAASGAGARGGKGRPRGRRQTTVIESLAAAERFLSHARLQAMEHAAVNLIGSDLESIGELITLIEDDIDENERSI